MHFYSFRKVQTFKRRLFRSAGPTATCCRRVGRADSHLLPPGRQGLHPLAAAGRQGRQPLAAAGQHTKLGTINWSPQFLRVFPEFSEKLLSALPTRAVQMHSMGTGGFCKVHFPEKNHFSAVFSSGKLSEFSNIRRGGKKPFEKPRRPFGKSRLFLMPPVQSGPSARAARFFMNAQRLVYHSFSASRIS